MNSTPDQVATATAQYGTWLTYSGSARVVLAAILLAAAAGAAYAAFRLPLPVRPARPTAAARIIRVVTWVSALVALLVCLAVDLKHMQDEHLLYTPPVDPITPVTFLAAGMTLIVIVVAGSRYGGRTALVSGVIGAMAAPMIFEFPFDLIVMARTYPPIPPDPVAWRALFFAPLILVELTTLALLTLSPMVRLSRAALYFFALMLGVFAVWGLSGFGYPSAPLPITLNVVSKLLAFAAALSLFLPQRGALSAPGGAATLPAPIMQAPPARVRGNQEQDERGAGSSAVGAP